MTTTLAISMILYLVSVMLAYIGGYCIGFISGRERRRNAEEVRSRAGMRPVHRLPDAIRRATTQVDQETAS